MIRIAVLFSMVSFAIGQGAQPQLPSLGWESFFNGDDLAGWVDPHIHPCRRGCGLRDLISRRSHRPCVPLPTGRVMPALYYHR